MSFWLTMIALGFLTFLTRFSFIGLFHAWQPPDLARRALRFVPVAVLTAIIVPELLMPEGVLSLNLLENPRLLAGLAAILAAWQTRNATWTIVIGMTVFLLLRWLGGL